MTNKLLSCILIGMLGAAATAGAQSRTLTIDEMFELAEANSKSIRAHRMAVDEAAEGVRVAKNDRLPSIEASLSFSYIGNGWMSDRDFSGGQSVGMPHYGNNFSLKATQTVYAGGAIKAGIEMSELQRQVAELELSDDRQSVRFLLVGYYLDLYTLHNQKRVYEKNIEQTRLLVDEIRASYANGVALRSDITRYELQLQELELGLTNTVNRARILSRQLATTIGLDGDTEIVPDTTVIDRTVAAAGEGEWQERRSGSPALRLAGLGVELSKKDEELARAGRRPSIGLIAANHLDGPILIEVPTIDSNFNYWYVGVNFSYSFDSLFKNNKKIKKAQLATMKAEEEMRLTEERLQNDIHSAYIQWEEAFTRLRSKETSVRLAHENYGVVHERYVNGLSLVTDMLDASNIQLSSELELNNARAEIVYQYYSLKRQVGDL